MIPILREELARARRQEAWARALEAARTEAATRGRRPVGALYDSRDYRDRRPGERR